VAAFPQPFNLNASTGGNRVVAPLTGNVTTGNWVTSQTLNVAAMIHGFIAFDYLLPFGYSTNVLYPILFYGHENDEGGVSSYPNSGIWNQSDVTNGAFNTVAFRTNFPCIVVIPYCDQTIDGSGSNGNANFGGYADTSNSGSNEQGVNALLLYFQANFSVDVTRCYCTGDSLGAIGSLAWMIDNNRLNGSNKYWTAGMGFSDQYFRPSGPAMNTVFTNMTSVHYIAVSDPNDNNGGGAAGAVYDNPAWAFYTGNNNYPSQSTYDNGGVAAIRAASSNFYYIQYNGTPWETFRKLNADGGDGTALYTLLFSYII
jgi:hypothetical protein